MIEYIAASLPIVSLFIYAILFSIECGATLFVFKPELLGDDDLVRGYINPAWETTNVFLIFSLIWLIAFFPGAVPVWGHALIMPFLLFLVIMGIRAVGMLYIFYKEGKNILMKSLLLVFSLAAPMALAGGILPFFITGAMPYGTSQFALAAYFACLALVSTLFISSSFFRYLAARSRRGADSAHAAKPLELIANTCLIVFLAATLAVFPMLASAAAHLANGMWRILPPIILLAILNLIYAFLAGKRHAAMRLFLAVTLFGAVFFSVMLSQLPYVIYPAITIFSSFTDPASATIMLDALGIAALFIVPSLVLLYYLVVSKKD